MKFIHKPFEKFVNKNSSARTRARYSDSEVEHLTLDDHGIDAMVLGTKPYQVHIELDDLKVVSAHCDCPYDYGDACKHIVNTLVEADDLLASKEFQNDQPEEPLSNLTVHKKGTSFFITEKSVSELSIADIKAVSMHSIDADRLRLKEATLNPDQFIGIVTKSFYDEFQVDIIQRKNTIQLNCSCANSTDKLCQHLRYMLLCFKRFSRLEMAFNRELRHQFITEETEAETLGITTDLDDYYRVLLTYDSFHVEAKQDFFSASKATITDLKQAILPDFKFPKSSSQIETQEFIVANEDYGNFYFRLMEAPLAKNGKLKSPVTPVDLSEKLSTLSTQQEFLFITSMVQQDSISSGKKVPLPILKNPLNLPIYTQKGAWRNRKLTPKKLIPATFPLVNISARVLVAQTDKFYVLTLTLNINSKTLSSKTGKLIGRYLKLKNTIYYLQDDAVYNILLFFTNQHHEVLIAATQFAIFKTEFLNQLERAVEVHYSFIKKAPQKLLKKTGLDKVTEHMIYLSESDDYILITPVMRYGEIEAPVLSSQKIYTEDGKGKMHEVKRHQAAEDRFKRILEAQHSTFAENQHADFYYLHKQEFIDQGWFIDAFEAWRAHDYTILGFKQLKNSKNLNPHKMNVNTAVKSGIDWFDIETIVSFGDQEVELKQLRKSIVNKTRFIQLSDGSKGLMPEEWVEKFSQYFRSGEIKGNHIRAHKSHFALIDQLFDKEVLSAETKVTLEVYREKLANFHSIRNITPPKALKATLRDYQKEGLNWLNFLDEFDFGGCLADDMGLGKTIQLIAYFLVQLEKGRTAPNLVIVPTTLLHNWKNEIDKFAPSLSYKVVYGNKRNTPQVKFANYTVILTTYGTMLNDIETLKETRFNTVVLDESQAIKNPNSKRYKAARLLQARQRLVATGTPVENNTFDLYAQLSFAMPGLLGSARQFTADYSSPIDKFQNESRAKELQEKVRPFLLRRTKKEVALELPEKTEMISYCEMGTAQRRVYDTYKKEFQKFLKKKSDDEIKASSMHILQGLTKLRQICNTPALLSDNEYYGNSSAKLDELMKQISQLQQNHKIIVFSQFVRMLELVKERLIQADINYAYLTGKTRKRQEQVDAFQDDDDVRVFLISLKAGGTGLNLTEAEYVFLIDPWWNPAVENQAIDRAYRIGQINNVVAVRMITPNSIEEKIMRLQDRKKQLVEDLIHTDSGFFKQLSKDDLINIV